MKVARGHLAVLLCKADNDDRLIAALQAALKQQGSSGSGSAATKAMAPAISDTAGATAEPSAVMDSPGGSGGSMSDWPACDVLRIGSIGGADGQAAAGTKLSEGSRRGTAADSLPQAPHVIRSELERSAPAVAVAAATAAADAPASEGDAASAVVTAAAAADMQASKIRRTWHHGSRGAAG